MKHTILFIYHGALVVFLRNSIYWKSCIIGIILEGLGCPNFEYHSTKSYLPYDGFILYIILKFNFFNSLNKRVVVVGRNVDVY